MDSSQDATLKTLDAFALEFAWLTTLYYERMAKPDADILQFSTLAEAPTLNPENFCGAFLLGHPFAIEERMLMGLTLMATLAPSNLMDIARSLHDLEGSTELQLHGVVTSEKTDLPSATMQTLMVLLAGSDTAARHRYLQFFWPGNQVFRHDYVRISKEDGPGNSLGCVIYASPDLMSIVLAGHIQIPEFSPDFPAKRIETKGEWSDLVLEATTLRQVQEVAHWVKHEHHIMDGLGMRKKIRPGYRALFYGPPGTGKTFTCALLGKSTGLPVYRVDLSLVVSKYIGETEKNLARVFNHAEKHKWILFFDEADALFGKRTAVSDARDRFANQEVSYLLQKVEEYDGVVILATNFKGNIDMAFTRRFENMVHFPMPSAKERELIWRATLPAKLPLAPDIDLQKVAEKFDLSGASIVDAVRAAVLLSVAGEGDVLLKRDLMEAIQREYYKFGRVCEI
jgi:ATPase family associated with various cellular activities (AAA)